MLLIVYTFAVSSFPIMLDVVFFLKEFLLLSQKFCLFLYFLKFLSSAVSCF